MTSNGIEKSRPPVEAPRPLPHLPVLRDAWCDQATVDAAADYLQAHNPELLSELHTEEGIARGPEYFDVVFEIVDYLAEEGQSVPATPLGRLDLAIELSRRVRKAYGMPDFRPRGHALAAAPEKLPPLTRVAVSEGAARRGNVTQEMADAVLQKAYAQRPDLWFAASEEYRHLIPLWAIDELRQLITGIVDADVSAGKNDWTAGEIFGEASRRLYEMCGIGT